MISVKGSAARRASVGDLLIIASFAQVAEADVAKHEPQLVLWMSTTNKWACATMCLPRLRLGMERMSVEFGLTGWYSPQSSRRSS
jgi:Aspartate decarboxylase